MPLKVTFELSDKDLRFFKAKAAAMSKRAADRSEEDLIAAAKALLEGIRQQEAPAFVKERGDKLQELVDMLEDTGWRMPIKDRERVLKAVSYLAEPDDIIPDTIPGLGYLDDAILIELVVAELKHELDAYEDFCQFRKTGRKTKGLSGKPVSSEEWLEARRQALQERMRRRRRREREARQNSGSRSPWRLF